MDRTDAKTVLIVDDEADFRSALREFLELSGLRVLDASNGEDALRLLAERRPDLMTLDLHMPGVDGWQVLHALRADPALAVPVAVVASGTRVEAGVGGAPVVAFFEKPVEPRLFRAALAELLHQALK